MDRGLRQRDAADTIGVTTNMVMRWETGRSGVSVRHLTAVLDFLGYDPRPKGTTLGERVRYKREGMGLSQETLAGQLGVDPSSVRRVEKDRHIGPRLQAIFKGFVADDQADH